MKITSIAVYCITYMMYVIFFGNAYTMINISYNTALIILIICNVLLAAMLIFDHFFYEKVFKQSEENLEEQDPSYSDDRGPLKKVS